MSSTIGEPPGSPDEGSNRATSMALLIGGGAAVIAGAAIWLMLTEPMTVASAIDSGEVTPLVRRLAEVIYNALAGLLAYL